MCTHKHNGSTSHTFFKEASKRSQGFGTSHKYTHKQNTHTQPENTHTTHKNYFQYQLMHQKVCMHTFMLTYIYYMLLPYSTHTVQQEIKSFKLQSVLGQSSQGNNDAGVLHSLKFLMSRILVQLCHARWGEQHSHRGPGNQLPLSQGSGLATREWQHARHPHGQAVIIWFTHNQLLIVSHWAAGTCNLE